MGFFDFIGPGSEDVGNIGNWSGDQYADFNGNPVWGQYFGYRDQNQHVDPSTGAAETDVRRARSLGEAAAQRQAYQNDYTDANSALGWGYSDRYNANADRDSQLGAAAMQRGAADLQYQAAMGNTPSRAELLGRNMLDQGFQQQLAAAAGARGGGLAQAAAQRQAYQGGAGYYQQGMNSLASLRADEMARAREGYGQSAAAYMQGLHGVRAQDYMGAQNATSMADAYARMAAQQGENEMRQRTLNDLQQQYFEGQGWNTRNAQANLGVQSEQLRQGVHASQVENQRYQAGQMNQLYGSLASAGSTFGGSMIASGASNASTGSNSTGGSQNYIMGGHDNPYAEGGPAKSGKPMLVGEHGPEIIVPKQDAVIIPNTADQPSVFYGPDGRPYANTAAGPAPLTPPQREMKSFRRDTPAQQKATTDAYHASLARAADAQMAAYGRQLQQGPAVARYEGEIDQAPPGWLADYMATQPTPSLTLGQGAITPAEMRAAAAMRPSLMGGREDPYLVAAREDGGPVEAGQPTMVGENGPEYVAPAIASTLPPPKPPLITPEPQQITLRDAAAAYPTLSQAAAQRWQVGTDEEPEAVPAGALPPPDPAKIAQMAAAKPMREMKTFERTEPNRKQLWREYRAATSPEEMGLAYTAAVLKKEAKDEYDSAKQALKYAAPVSGLAGGYLMSPVVGAGFFGAAPVHAAGGLALAARARLNAEEEAKLRAFRENLAKRAQAAARKP
jgi:hypothetical protein